MIEFAGGVEIRVKKGFVNSNNSVVIVGCDGLFVNSEFLASKMCLRWRRYTISGYWRVVLLPVACRG